MKPSVYFVGMTAPEPPKSIFSRREADCGTYTRIGPWAKEDRVTFDEYCEQCHSELLGADVVCGVINTLRDCTAIMETSFAMAYKPAFVLIQCRDKQGRVLPCLEAFVSGLRRSVLRTPLQTLIDICAAVPFIREQWNSNIVTYLESFGTRDPAVYTAMTTRHEDDVPEEIIGENGHVYTRTTLT